MSIAAYFPGGGKEHSHPPCITKGAKKSTINYFSFVSFDGILACTQKFVWDMSAILCRMESSLSPQKENN